MRLQLGPAILGAGTLSKARTHIAVTVLQHGSYRTGMETCIKSAFISNVLTYLIVKTLMPSCTYTGTGMILYCTVPYLACHYRFWDCTAQYRYLIG